MIKFIWTLSWFFIGAIAFSIHVIQIMENFELWNNWFNYILFAGSTYVFISYYIKLKKIIEQ